MRYDQENAFVLHARPYRETSLLVELLTAQHGRIGLLARGVTGPRRQLLRAALQPLQWIRVDAVQRGELARLNAAEAVDYYMSIFKDAKKGTTAYYANDSHGKKAGEVLTVEFEIRGQKFLALNAGPEFTFTEAVSIIVECDSQEEIDHYWNSLTVNGGQEVQCGWLKDKYGLSWQITPAALPQLITKNPKKVFEVIMNSVKLNLPDLEAAANSR